MGISGAPGNTATATPAAARMPGYGSRIRLVTCNSRIATASSATSVSKNVMPRIVAVFSAR